MTTKAEQNTAAIAKMEEELRAVASKEEVKDGAIKYNARDIFEANLPEGVTPKLIDALQNHVTNTVAAAHSVNGEIGIAAMAGDKELDKFTAAVAFGPIGGMKSYVAREQIGRNPSTQEETRTVGANRATVDIFAPGGQRFDAVKTALKGLAADKLK